MSSKRDSRKGNAFIEFGIAFPVIVLVMGGLFQFGYAFSVYNALQNAVRGGARYASQADFDLPDGTRFISNVKNVVVYGSPGADPSLDPALAPGLSTSQVVVDVADRDGSGIPQSITVRISQYSLFKVWHSITLINKPGSTFTYMGQVK